VGIKIVRGIAKLNLLLYPPAYTSY